MQIKVPGICRARCPMPWGLPLRMRRVEALKDDAGDWLCQGRGRKEGFIEATQMEKWAHPTDLGTPSREVGSHL